MMLFRGRGFAFLDQLADVAFEIRLAGRAFFPSLSYADVFWLQTVRCKLQAATVRTDSASLNATGVPEQAGTECPILIGNPSRAAAAHYESTQPSPICAVDAEPYARIGLDLREMELLLHVSAAQRFGE